MLKAAVILLPVVIWILFYFVRHSGYLGGTENEPGLGSRLLLAGTGILMGAAGAIFFLVTVEDPKLYLFSGFVLGPIFALMGLFAVIVALFFPAENVQGVLRHFYKHLGPR